MRVDLILSFVLVAIALLVVTVLGAQLPRQRSCSLPKLKSKSTEPKP